MTSKWWAGNSHFLPNSTCPVMTVLLTCVFLSVTDAAFSQVRDNKLDVSGTLGITNNGISIVPALGLGKPAALLDLSVGRRFRFEPEMDFSINGKPWQYLFWVRYDLIKKDPFFLGIGANSAYLFRNVPVLIEGENKSKDIIQVRRVVGVDVNTRYSIKKNVDIGGYYLFGYGFESSVPTQTHYLSLHSDVTAISFFSDLYLNLRPQIYYLKIDDIDGLYLATNIALGVRNIPVTISSTINKIIDSRIGGNDDPL